jgi:hypothetical protein
MDDRARPPSPVTAPSPLRRLLHRWLVQYNPLYLLSATLVLGGMVLCSRGLASDGSTLGVLGIPAIAELYAVLLIGGAALLTRLGQRRPAVLLALITALYQCDLTLHTEACVLLGSVGIAAAAAWLLVFVAKLHALCWAVRLKPSRSAIATATLGAAGLAILPHALGLLDDRSGTALLAAWLFGLFSLGLHASREVVSRVTLDPWGATVLRRSLRAVWLLWSLLLVLHVGFWSLHYPVRLAALVPVALLVASGRLRSEARVWATVLGALVFVGLQLPELFAITSLLAAAALSLRALSAAPPRVTVVTEVQRPDLPYRMVDEARPEVSDVVTTCAPDGRSTARLLVGALFAGYLAVWTFGWTGGAWPAHVLGLDLALTAAVVALALRPRVRIAVAPLVASYAHFAVQSGLLAAPHSIVQWGAAAVGLGFALLVTSLVASYCLRDVAPEDATIAGGSAQQRKPIW